MKYKVMFWLMCAALYVCLFWCLPLIPNGDSDYSTVVFLLHVIGIFIVGFAWGFGYLAHKAFNL